jgi:hypothetical protein
MDSYNELDNALDYLNESYIINEKDIYYNKKAFDNGDINLCFITGHSGSGKSTMGAKAARHNDIETYSLDDLQCVKDHFTMDNLKEYGDLIYSYFNGPGKKFYLTYDEIIEKKLSGSDYEDKLFPGFVNYAKQYASSHKDKKFIIEGVWLFCDDEHGKPWFRPEEFKDYAFYIKGTSALISKYRAAKRNSKYDNGTNKVNKGFDRFKSFTKDFFTKNWKWYLIDEKRINVFRKYFKSLEENQKDKSVNESYNDIVLPEFSVELVDITRLTITESTICESTAYMKNLYSKRDLYPVYIVLSFSYTAFGTAIRAIKGSTYSHAGISLDSSLEDIYTFKFGNSIRSNGVKNIKTYNGFNVESLNTYTSVSNKAIVDVLCVFVNEKTKYKIQSTLKDFEKRESHTKYNFSNILNIVLGRASNMQYPQNLSYVCSWFVNTILNVANIKLFDNKPGNLVIPQDFANIKNNPKIYKVYEGYARSYSDRIVEAKLHELIEANDDENLRYNN